METEESKQHTIKFANRQFQIVSNDDEEHIQQLEQLLCDSFDEFSNQNNASISQTSLKVSLKLADELVRLKRKLNDLNNLLS